MRKLFYIKIAFFITLFFGVDVSYGQNFADKNFYLIDSLNTSEIENYLKSSIDSTLKLYHNSKTDTLKIKHIIALKDFFQIETGNKYTNIAKNKVDDWFENHDSLDINFETYLFYHAIIINDQGVYLAKKKQI